MEFVYVYTLYLYVRIFFYIRHSSFLYAIKESYLGAPFSITIFRFLLPSILLA